MLIRATLLSSWRHSCKGPKPSEPRLRPYQFVPRKPVKNYFTVILALRAIRRNAMRSALTSLGIIIGIGSVIAMVGIGNGAKAQIEASIASLGENVLMVFPGSFRSGGARSGAGGAATLTAEDAAAIREEIPGVAGVSPELRLRRQVLANGLNWSTNVMGVSPEYLEIRDWRMADGAMFSQLDVDRVSKVAVIGRTIANQLYPGENPIGQSIRLQQVPFQIVGVLEQKGFNFGGNDQDDIIMVPYTSHMKRLTRRSYLDSIVIKAADRDLLDDAELWVTDLLDYRHGRSAISGGESDFRVATQLEITERATSSTETMTALLGGIAGISLLVGGVGIMNIMLVSVTERTREIGIRLALGAHGKDVLKQFLIEAMVTSTIGGLLGVALGVGGASVLARFRNWPIETSPTVILAAVAFSAGIGIVFGVYPARRAAKLDPIEALRYE
jgi:putative ABC transport system permease protein